MKVNLEANQMYIFLGNLYLAQMGLCSVTGVCIRFKQNVVKEELLNT